MHKAISHPLIRHKIALLRNRETGKDLFRKEDPLSIKILAIITAPEGLDRIEKDHPDVPIYTAQVDEKLNNKGYIIPGLGDAGDRLFGTCNG